MLRRCFLRIIRSCFLAVCRGWSGITGERSFTFPSNHLKVSLHLEKNRRLLHIPPFLCFDPGQIGLKKFYLGAVRDYIKQMRIGDGGSEKIKGQSDILFNNFIFSNFLNPLTYLSLYHCQRSLMSCSAYCKASFKFAIERGCFSVLPFGKIASR